MSDIKTPLIWYGSAGHFEDWPEEVRQLTFDFLAIHDISPHEVPADDTDWSAISTPDGPRLRIWLHDLDENGRIVICPYCPGCARKRYAVIPLKAIPPPTPQSTYTQFAPEALAALGWPPDTLPTPAPAIAPPDLDDPDVSLRLSNDAAEWSAVCKHLQWIDISTVSDPERIRLCEDCGTTWAVPW